MTGDAAGMMIRDITDNRDARKDMPISFKDSGVFFTAPLVFRTITGIDMMQTTITYDVRPMPYAKTRSGIKAANGAACMTIKIGENSQSKNWLKPTHNPTIIPIMAEMAIPIIKGRKCSAYASNSLPSAVISISADIDSKNVGNAQLTGTLPAISHATQRAKAENNFNMKARFFIYLIRLQELVAPILSATKVFAKLL